VLQQNPHKADTQHIKKGESAQEHKCIGI
jgi:hypothetical protein